MSKWTVEKVQKKNLYNSIINAFKAKGWVDIASAPASEFNVLRSYDSQNRPIYIRLQPQTASGATYNVVTSAYTAFVIGVAKEYVPNPTAGLAGTFTLSNTASTAFAGTNVTTASTQVALETDNITLYHNITNTRGYFAVRFNSNNAYSATLGSVFFLGVPDDEYMDSNPRRASFFLGPNIATIGGIDYPQQYTLPESAAAVPYNSHVWLSPRTPDIENRFWMSPVFYSHANVGFRGRLDELYNMPASTFILDGDLINVGGVNYQLLKISATTATNLVADSFVCIEI